MTIHVFGRTFLDIFIYGESVHESKIVQTPGGSALNASLGFSLLGMDCYLHSSYGKDHNGELIRRVIDQCAVKINYLIEKNVPSNVFISQNGKALAAQVDKNSNLDFTPENAESEYCLIFATETDESTVESLIKKPWKDLFVDLGPKYSNKKFPMQMENAVVIGNETESENNPCDLIKLGKEGARWHGKYVPGNGKELPYTTGAGDLFDVVFIHNMLSGKSKLESMKEAIDLSQKACLVPGSSTKINVLREFYHFV